MSATPRKSKTTTFSLPPETEAQTRRVMKEGGRTVSDVLHEAIRLYMGEREWLRSDPYREIRDREQRIG